MRLSGTGLSGRDGEQNSSQTGRDVIKTRVPVYSSDLHLMQLVFLTSSAKGKAAGILEKICSNFSLLWNHPEGSLPWSQQPVTGPCRDLDDSSPHPSILVFEDLF
jgi:hypothetical protein